MILAYHEVSLEPDAYLYSITATRFSEHLRLITEARYRTAWATACEVTFDDGHISQYERGFSMLQQYSCLAKFFVTAGWIGVRSTSMNWRQLKELVACGHEVQSHGWSHKFLKGLPPADLKEELERSRLCLEDGLGVPVNAISIPGGRWDRRVIDGCAEAGYTRVYVSTPWTRASKGEVTICGRLMILKTTKALDLQRMANAGGMTRFMQRVRIHGAEAARAVLGDMRYHRIWCVLADWRGKAAN
jgi:Polysaccharide deacetylase